ncbi:MAG: hypothetical protein ACOXZK_11400 [Bacteroidales bacterium]
MPKPNINIPDKRYWVILSILIAFAVYKGVGNYGYVNWDDDENIRQNIKFTEWNIENLSYHFHVNHYKSLAIFSYMAEYKLFEATPKTYHNNNLILHLLNIFLVFILNKKAVFLKTNSHHNSFCTICRTPRFSRGGFVDNRT